MPRVATKKKNNAGQPYNCDRFQPMTLYYRESKDGEEGALLLTAKKAPDGFHATGSMAGANLAYSRYGQWIMNNSGNLPVITSK